MEDGTSKAWFAPKRYGYGSGLPIAWQGWATLLVFIAAVALAPIIFSGVAQIILIGLAVVALATICALKTEGGWRWR